eukprot:PhF_6_TR11582/c0_g1_i6/m.18729
MLFFTQGEEEALERLKILQGFDIPSSQNGDLEYTMQTVIPKLTVLPAHDMIQQLGGTITVAAGVEPILPPLLSELLNDQLLDQAGGGGQEQRDRVLLTPPPSAALNNLTMNASVAFQQGSWDGMTRGLTGPNVVHVKATDFVLSLEDIVRLRDTHRVVTSSRLLPKSFWNSVSWLFGDDTWYQYSCVTAASPFRATRDDISNLEHKLTELRTPSLQLYCESMKKKELDFRRAKIVEQIRTMLPTQVDRGGFGTTVAKDLDDRILPTPTIDFGSAIVQTIKGYFTHYGRTSNPVAFASVGLPDFSATRSPTVSWFERDRYLVVNTPTTNQGPILKEGARAALLQRFQETFRLMVRGLRLQGAKEVVIPCPTSILAQWDTTQTVGLQVYEIFVEALLNALEDTLQYFEVVYLYDPHQHNAKAGEMLRHLCSARSASSAKGGKHPTVMIHQYDSIELAVKLAKARICVGFVVWASCLETLGDRVGEVPQTIALSNEFLFNEGKPTMGMCVATISTLFLQHYNVCPEVRMQNIADDSDLPTMQDTSWLAVLPPTDYDKFRFY